MRYNPPVRPTVERVNAWVGQEVTTTYGAAGKVVSASATVDGRILLAVETVHGDLFETDNEHATIVRDRSQS